MDFEIKDGVLVKYNGNGPDVVIPENVTEIGSEAFCGEGTMESITLSSGLQRIPEEAFYSRSTPRYRFNQVRVGSLDAWLQTGWDTSMLLDQNNDLFIGGEKVDTLIVPNSIERIRDHAFFRCRNLERVEILGNTIIGERAFSQCYQLEEVTLPYNLKQIEKNAFDGCQSLKKLNLPDGIERIEQYAFAGAPIEKIIIPEGIDRITKSMFYGNKALKAIEIPAHIKEIEYSAFAFCENLEHVVLPEGLKVIGASAFGHCPKIKELTIPSTVESVDSGLPENLEKLTIKCKWSAINILSFKFRNNPIESIYIAEEYAEEAKKLNKRSRFFNLEGQPIKSAKKSTSASAVPQKKATALKPTRPGEIIVTYPADAPDMTAAIEPFVISKGSPKSFTKPAIKELLVQDGKWQFTVVLKIATKLPSIWKRYYLNKGYGEIYDPKTALGQAVLSSGYIDDGTGAYVSSPLLGNIPAGLDSLTPEEVEKRLVSFVTTCNQCVQQEPIRRIMKGVQKKKDGKLYKNRVLHLAYLNLVDEDGTTFELVAKNEDDLNLCIELRGNVPVTDELLRQSYVF